MATKTATLTPLFAAVFGVTLALVVFGQTGPGLDVPRHAMERQVDRDLFAREAQRKVLGAGSPKGFGVSSSEGPRVLDDLSLTFTAGGPGAEEANMLATSDLSSDVVELYPNEVELAGLAVVVKTVANGMWLDDIQKSEFYQSECPGSECTVIETAVRYIDQFRHASISDPQRSLRDLWVDTNQSHFSRNNTLRWATEKNNWQPIFVDPEERKLGRPIAQRSILVYGDCPGYSIRLDSGALEIKELQHVLVSAMDSLEDALGESLAAADPSAGDWYVHNYSDDSSSWSTPQVVTDVLYGLELYNAGSILFCGQNEDPFYVYEIGVHAQSVDDLEAFHDHLDSLFMSTSTDSFCPPTPHEFHTGLISKGLQLDVTHIRYRDGLDTKPVTLRGDEATAFLTTCTDSLIDP